VAVTKGGTEWKIIQTEGGSPSIGDRSRSLSMSHVEGNPICERTSESLFLNRRPAFPASLFRGLHWKEYFLDPRVPERVRNVCGKDFEFFGLDSDFASCL